ncbi:MAG TPA: AmmeMemoRadiSam system radical SAM enzyme [bacterium]|nr:AmmeMemoRadiSam system radical SAM enzyme [bacterium]
MVTERREAAYYTVSENILKCRLCPQECAISDGGVGICRTRVRDGEKLYLTNYGEYTALGMDPIEKKPLYHFYPGWDILSIGGKGCNFKCVFCQNSTISQGDCQTRHIEPKQLAEESLARAANSIGLAFTYNEPFIWFEFIRDTAPLIRKNGQKVVLVTNGYVNPDPLNELMPHIDAMNIDLKAFEDGFYRKYCGGGIEPVKKTIVSAFEAGIHVELTILLIPTLNDSMDLIGEQVEWIASISKDIPFHISRYFPSHKMEIPPTPLRTLQAAYDIASEKLNYVYLGNVGNADHARSKCPECGHVLVDRNGYRTNICGMDAGCCSGCGATLAFVRETEDK